IVAYPISAPFRERFEGAVDDHPRYLALQELRRLPLVRSFRALRSIHGAVCYIPLEDPSSQALLPILALAAALGGASALVIVRHDLSLERSSKLRALRAALLLAGTS